MNLLFAIKSLNVKGGGAERVLVDLANGLVKRGHSVRILTFDFPGVSFYKLDPRIERVDLSVGEPGKPTPRLGFLLAIPRLRRAVQEISPDLLVAFMHSTYVPITFALLGKGVKIIASEHATARHFNRRPIQAALMKTVLRLTAGMTVPSETARASFGVAYAVVVPNTLDLNAFAGVSVKVPADPPLLLCVGRFMEEKNHIQLLEAFALLRERFPCWRLRLVGDGELRADIERTIRRLNLSQSVELTGAVSDIPHHMSEASIVVVPSKYESFGLVAAEALASGRPVVAFDCCSGVAEMVCHNVNGLLVSAAGDQVHNMAKSLAKLMESPAIRAQLGLAGPRSVQRYAIENIVVAWEGFLESRIG